MLSTTLKDPTYYINKLKPTSFSTNQFVYLSGFEGSIDIINEQWVFDFKIYLNGEFNVPTNTLYVDLITPFAEKLEIPIVQQQITSSLPSYVDTSTNANLYMLNAIIPTGSSEYFNSKLINHRINIDLGFHVDPNNLNKTSIDEETRSEFIKEFDSIRTSTNVSYTNFHSGDDQGNGNIVEKYYVVNDSYNIVNPKPFSWYLNDDCLDLTTPLRSIVDIEFKSNFIVRGYSIEFNYSLDDTGMKTLKYKDENPVYCYDKFHLDCPFATSFDETKKEVVQTEGSVHGFYIPRDASGYYIVTLLLATTNNWITLKLTKNFNFIADSSSQSQLVVEQHFIRSLQDYKRMVI